MLRIVLALFGSGLVRFALVNVRELPRSLANMLTVLTFMTIVIYLPPFLDSMLDIGKRMGVPAIIKDLNALIEKGAAQSRDAIAVVTKELASTVNEIASIGNCGAVAFDNHGRVSYSWGTWHCFGALESARRGCPQCNGYMTAWGTIALVNCSYNNSIFTAPGSGFNWVVAENSAYSTAGSYGFPRFSCHRILILHATRGKIG